MGLDFMIESRSASQRGRGQLRGLRQGWVGSFHGRGASGQRPLRVTSRPSSYSVTKSFSQAKDLIWKHDLFNESMAAVGLSEVENGTKLYISNLDFGVSKQDIKELFSEIGHLKQCAVHYGQNGHPSGSAEVVFTRRSDAVAAVKRYNNVQLDGRPMKIEVIGTNLGLPIAPRVNVTGVAKGRGKRAVVMTPDFGHGASFKPVSRVNRGSSLRGRGRGRVNRHGQFQVQAQGKALGRTQSRTRGRGVKRNNVKSAEELDMELDKYHAEAKP